MKPRILTSVTLCALFVALAVPARLSAQHTRYKLIDIGTLGGPTSYESDNGFGNRVLNNAGQISSSADTAIPDPNAPKFCFNVDCFLAHAVRWNDGILTDLGTLPGNNSKASAINARGWIAGISPTDLIDPVTGGPVNHAVLWKGDEPVDLGTLGGNQSVGVYVNDGGQVVGMSTINTVPDPFSFFGAPTHPFIWKDGKKMDLGTLGGPDAFSGQGCVNEREGLVVGSSLTNSIPNPTTGFPTVDPFLWRKGTMTDLGTLGGVFGFAQCANNRGQVIGQSDLSGDLTAHPFVWDQGMLTDIGTLGGDFGTALWINDSGEVVGWADLPGGEVHHAFLWNHRGMTDLGTLGRNSAAFAINSRSQVVGRSRIDDTTVHAMLWQKGGPMIDLNNLIPSNSALQLVDAFDINDRGEIAVLGVPPGVVPDPESIGAHVAVLIPCDENNTSGCADDAGFTRESMQNGAAPIAISSTSTQSRPTPRERVAAWRAQMAQRYRIANPRPSKD